MSLDFSDNYCNLYFLNFFSFFTQLLFIQYAVTYLHMDAVAKILNITMIPRLVRERENGWERKGKEGGERETDREREREIKNERKRERE